MTCFDDISDFASSRDSVVFVGESLVTSYGTTLTSKNLKSSSLAITSSIESVNNFVLTKLSISQTIVQVVSSDHATAILTSSGAVYTYGSAGHGGSIPSDYTTYLTANVASLYSTSYGFAALTTTGDVYVWGRDNIQTSTQDDSRLVNVLAIYTNRGTFACVKSDGDVILIGSAQYGGEYTDGSDAVIDQKIAYIVPTMTGFFAVKESTLEVIAWGNEDFGNSLTDLLSQLSTSTLYASDISYMTANTKSVVMVASSNSHVYAWGESTSGGSISTSTQSLLNAMSISEIINTERAYAALSSNKKTIVVWGNSNYGGSITSDMRFIGDSTKISSSGDNFIEFTKEVAFIASTKSAVVVLLSDNTMITWGKLSSTSVSSLSTTLTSVQTILSSGKTVQDVITNEQLVVIQLASKEFIVFGASGYQHHTTC